MKQCKKIKRYAFGANAIGNWDKLSGAEQLDAISGGVSAVTNMVGNAKSKKDVTVGSVLSGTASGAAAGAQVGGAYGAIIGGAIGLGTSLSGRQGSVDQETGDIDYGSGFGKWFGRSRHSLQQEGGSIKNTILSRNNAEQIAADYYMDNGYNGISFAADGGILPNSLAYLDDGELIRTPDGSISEIPEEHKNTDSNLMSVPVGTQVLSDKLKVPGTNKTFAEMGKKIMNRRKSSGNDVYAQNSAKLNDMNSQIAYQQLLDQQEMLKAEKGYKDGVPAYNTGTDGTRVAPRLKQYGYNPDITQFKYWDKEANDYQQGYKDFVNNITELQIKDIFSGKYGDMSTYLSKNKGVLPTVEEARRLMTDKKYGDWHKMFGDAYEASTQKPVQNGPAAPQFDPYSIVPHNIIKVPINKVHFDGPYSGHYNYLPDPVKRINAYYGDTITPKTSKSFNLGDIPADIAALSGPLANIFGAKPEQVDTYTYDPVYGPTEYNIDPLLRQATLTDSISRYNMANVNPNTGANMAYGLQSAQVRNKAIADAYSQKFNAETPLAFQNAQIANTWGQQYANARHTAAVEQAENNAAARAIRNQGYADLSTRIQQIARDKKLANRDRGLYNALQDYLSYGMTTKQIQDLNRYFQ